MPAIPKRDATDRFLERMGRHGRKIDISFDVDLGELTEGHRVLARGLELAETGAVLHYEFVPGITESESDGFAWYWSLEATDDTGTAYDESDTGAFDPSGGGTASHGERDLGGIVPPHATLLVLRFSPAHGWEPQTPWRRELVIDLKQRRVADVP